MPISQSAKKSLRVALRNKKDNSSFKNKLKTIIKKFVVKPSKDGLDEVYSVLDKAIKKHVYHPNKVSRLKAKFAKSIGQEKKAPVKKATKKVAKKK